MKFLILYPYPPEPDGQSLQGHYLMQGLRDIGEDVMELQKVLQGLGFFPATQTITSYFGLVTQDAVKQFQARYKILQTGNVGPITKKALNDL